MFAIVQVPKNPGDPLIGGAPIVKSVQQVTSIPEYSSLIGIIFALVIGLLYLKRNKVSRT